MAPSIRRICKAPCAHLVAARHARVERIFGNVDTQYSVDHWSILPPRLFSKSSASNNLVRRIYAHARPKIPSNLNSGAWKTGPNLPHGLIRQRDARGSPFSSLLSNVCIAKQSATYKGRSLLSAPRTKPYGRLSRIRLVWGFLCQGWRTSFFAPCLFILLFELRREHSSALIAYCRRRRAQRGSRTGFFSAAEGWSLTNASTAANCRDRVVCKRDDPRGARHWPRAITREPRLYSVEPRRVPTMKQSYASASKAPRRRVHSPSGIAAIAVCGLPPPQIVIDYRA